MCRVNLQVLTIYEHNTAVRIFYGQYVQYAGSQPVRSHHTWAMTLNGPVLILGILPMIKLPPPPPPTTTPTPPILIDMPFDDNKEGSELGFPRVSTVRSLI